MGYIIAGEKKNHQQSPTRCITEKRKSRSNKTQSISIFRHANLSWPVTL